MYAAVRSLDSASKYEVSGTPVPFKKNKVLAAGLHSRVGSQANGSHYTSSEELPLILGIDAIATGMLKVNSVPFPLAKGEKVWNAPSVPGQRVVFVRWVSVKK